MRSETNKKNSTEKGICQLEDNFTKKIRNTFRFCVSCFFCLHRFLNWQEEEIWSKLPSMDFDLFVLTVETFNMQHVDGTHKTTGRLVIEWHGIFAAFFFNRHSQSLFIFMLMNCYGFDSFD